MSFRGEIREFELPDILQLIASQGKAGWLKVMTRGDCRFVFFRDGKITSTKNPTDETDPFERYLVKRSLVTPDARDRVAAIRRKTGMDVQDILEKEGLMERDAIQEVFEAMVEEDIFELVSIKSGQYEFETEDRPAEIPAGALRAEIGPILMEAARKADEIAEMQKALGGEEAILVVTTAGRAREEASAEEEEILRLVNGSRTTLKIVDESPLDRYTVIRTLFECARRGWVAILKGARRATKPAEAVQEEYSVARTVRWAAPLVGILCVSVLFSEAFGQFRGPDRLIGEWLSRRSFAREVEAKRSVEVAIEAYRVKQGRYPATLEALAEEELVAEDELARDGRSRWRYAVSPSGRDFALVPAPAKSHRE